MLEEQAQTNFKITINFLECDSVSLAHGSNVRSYLVNTAFAWAALLSKRD